MEISFHNFPFDFKANNNPFRSLMLELELEIRQSPEIAFYGCYPEKTLWSKALLYLKSKVSSSGMTAWLNLQNGMPTSIDPNKLNFWTTFENRRPPVDSTLFSFSFDLDSYKGTNFYLPLIYLYMDLQFKFPYSPRHLITQEKASTSREIPENLESRKKRAACTFISNPHPMRIRAIREFGAQHEIDIFGRFAGNYVANKIEKGQSYWLNFCFENDLYPGYVTEKALEAWLSYSIPVYWGDDAAGILNPRAIVNLKDFKSMEDFLSHLDKLLGNKEMMLEMISQPILNKKLDLPELQKFIINASNSLRT